MNTATSWIQDVFFVSPVGLNPVITGKASPLFIPEDAVVVDSSHLSAEEVVGAVLAAIRERMEE